MESDNGYGEIGYAMVELAKQQPGHLGFESTRDADGFGIFNSCKQLPIAQLSARRGAAGTVLPLVDLHEFVGIATKDIVFENIVLISLMFGLGQPCPCHRRQTELDSGRGHSPVSSSLPLIELR
jgi:hypothetical protein